MDTYQLIELNGGAHVELELDDDNDITVSVAGASDEDDEARFYLTEDQALQLIAALSVKVAQAQLARQTAR